MRIVNLCCRESSYNLRNPLALRKPKQQAFIARCVSREKNYAVEKFYFKRN